MHRLYRALRLTTASEINSTAGFYSNSGLLSLKSNAASGQGNTGMMRRRIKAIRSDEDDLPDSLPDTSRSKSTSQLEGLKTGIEALRRSDKLDKWCIYRVPSKLRGVNEAAYTPQLLSVGLFHHGKAELKDMENHKTEYVEYFFERTLKDKAAVRSFIEDHKEKILHCYAGTIELGEGIDPVDIILVDACFIIELFLRRSGKENGDKYTKDYILSTPWVWKATEQDLILFENQLPYFLLQELYDYAFPGAPSISHAGKEIQSHKSSTNNKRNCLVCFQDCLPCYCWIHPNDRHVIKMDHESEPERIHDHFLELACNFFKNYSEGKSVRVKPKHFTDLVRYFMCPEEAMEWKKNTTNCQYNMRMLTAAGVNFMPFPKAGRFVVKEGKSFKLTIFKGMDLKLSQFCVKDETECIIRNVMAVEQFLYPDDAYVCNYFLLMDKLVDTVEDVDFLIHKKVIVNMLGSNKAVVDLVNHLCNQILRERSCYVHICKELNEHYENRWNRRLTNLKQVYFKDMWTGSSTIFGIVVMGFSIIGSINSFKK